MESNKKITIIGAGISGLIAAIELEKLGFNPIVIEATDRVGGRVKTDIVDEFQLDHGFQVLLEAYPKAKKYLNYKTLELQKLIPGAVIYKNRETTLIGDPLRDFSLLVPTILANVGSIKDKLAIFKLNLELKNKSLEAIFDSEQVSTLQYLRDKGFSERIIKNFFKPFFSDIFLETDLRTSSAMFQFTYKMFGEGLAVIPKDGIQAIPNQLKSQLTKTVFRFNTRVKTVEEGCIVLEDDSVITSDIIVIATDASKILGLEKPVVWKSCDNLYFEVEQNTLKKPIIGLLANNDSLINNIFYTTSVANNNKSKGHLLSVTIVKSHNLGETNLISQVKSELKNNCGIIAGRFVKRYRIKKALPDLERVDYKGNEDNFKFSETIYLAGDTQLNGSLNAAMTSGEAVAKLIAERFK
ncbi:FAD-dependent oxidoreductase [Flavobacterium degerlachei]|jgi:protoporphyrinogen oxidase|uniref:Flavin containing amine oxidoreductase n=1 Tax=Flavobacterium degerlachei TaxID=229203 RepID=A0A1H3EV62_9FLAO|nr:FAD-dependent oxidoreductase [Flavobacterium degerlachei]SDX82626.1 Flavin containing amine oxidoreductase [Flavobacterium degerlachei]